MEELLIEVTVSRRDGSIVCKRIDILDELSPSTSWSIDWPASRGITLGDRELVKLEITPTIRDKASRKIASNPTTADDRRRSITNLDGSITNYSFHGDTFAGGDGMSGWVRVD